MMAEQEHNQGGRPFVSKGISGAQMGKNVIGCEAPYESNDMISSVYLNVGKFIYSFISIKSYEHHELCRPSRGQGTQSDRVAYQSTDSEPLRIGRSPASRSIHCH